MIDKQKKWIESFINYMTNDKYYSSYTIKAYQTDIFEFLQFTRNNNIDWVEISPDQISMWLDNLYQKKISVASISRKLSSLRSFFDYLIKYEGFRKNKFTLFFAPKLKSYIPTTLSIQEIFQMIELLPIKTILERRNKYILILLYATGLRSEELCTLRCDQLFLDQHLLKVVGKGNKERYVPLVDCAVQSILLWLEERKLLDQGISDTVFLSKNGQALTTSMIRKIIGNWSNDYSSLIKKRISPHVFRYTCASHLLDNQASIRHIQDLLGHNSISTTQKYTKISITNMKKKFDQFHPHAK